MQVVCAYCLQAIAERPPLDCTDVSHGICDACMQVVLADDGKNLQTLIEEIQAPILVFDGDVVAMTANTLARNILGKNLSTIRGYRGGDIIECQEARKPGGCGHQGICKACVIRASVTKTHTTGKAVERALAEQTVFVKQTDDSEIKVKQRFAISTRKYHDLVLLRVDDVSQVD